MKRTTIGVSIKIITAFVTVGTLSTLFYSGSNAEFQNSIWTPQRQGTNEPVSIYNKECCIGYTLLNDLGTELIDMNGTLIHRWDALIPMPAIMMPGGSIIVGKNYKFCSITCGDFTSLKEIDWNGSNTWSFSSWEDVRAKQHHDVQREGNPVGYYAPGQDFISKGRTLVLAHHNVINTSISRKPLIDDVIYEIDWNGSLTGFEWHAADHFDQMGFDTSTKHGIYVNPGILGDGDWLHVNSMSVLGKNPWYSMDPSNYSCFNPENILIDSRNTNLIAIISRTTGDIVWKVGPEYPKQSENGQNLDQIIGLHNAHMIPKGLPGEGDILLFDNGGLAGYGYFGMPRHIRLWSRVIEFNPVTCDIVWQYPALTLNSQFPRIGESRFFSYYLGSAQRLPNGNTLITDGANGRVIEVTNTSRIVWEYNTYTRVQKLYQAYRIPPEWVPGNPSGYTFWEEQ